MKQYWIARLPLSFLLKRKKPWNSTDMGDDRGEGWRIRSTDTPQGNETAKHWDLAPCCQILALWRCWEAFINYLLFWEQSAPPEAYPTASLLLQRYRCWQNPALWLRMVQGETQRWPKWPLCHWAGDHSSSPLCLPELWLCVAQPPCTHSTRCHARSRWHGCRAGLCHLLLLLWGHLWERGCSPGLGCLPRGCQLPRWQAVGRWDAAGFSTFAEHRWNVKHLGQMGRCDKAPFCP